VHVLVGDDERDVPSGSSLDLRAALGAVSTTSAVTSDEVVQPELQRAIEAQDAAAVVAALGHEEDLERATAVASLEPVLRRGWATPDVVHLLEARRQARADKQWALSDLLRDGLLALGLVVEDTPDGQRVHDLER
jgi:cysteinyl-tRNA synthetase